MQASQLEPSLSYFAFLSYRSTDKVLAVWLHKRLERYRVPHRLVGSVGKHGVVPRRIRPIFRDRDDARTAEDIENYIALELGRAQHLIVLCTPRAAEEGSWVGREIELFRAARPGADVHAVIGYGEPPGCFPSPLLSSETDGQIRMPLAADLRRESEGGDGRTKGLIKLIAGLVGVSPDELWRRERRRRTRRLAFAGMLCLATAAAASWAASEVWQRRLAARDAAVVRSAAAIADSDPTTAALVLTTLTAEREPDGAGPLAARLAQEPLATILRGHQGRILSVQFSSDSTHVLTSGADGTARIWRADGMAPPGPCSVTQTRS